MKKMGILLTLVLLLTGCGSAEETTNGLSGNLSASGSTSMEAVMAVLTESFTAKHPGVTITYDPTGSGAGIAAVMAGTADIGLSSRELKATETGLTATVLAYDGIAVLVNPQNPVDDLTVEEIRGLVTGQITSWDAVGGQTQPVTVIGREAGSGTREGFESLVGAVGECVYDQELTSTGAVMAAVAANAYAVGYASVSAVRDTVKTVTVGGVAATEAAILDGSYAIRRPFLLVTQAQPSPLAQAFLDYALCDEATDLIAATGAVQAQ